MWFILVDVPSLSCLPTPCAVLLPFSCCGRHLSAVGQRPHCYFVTSGHPGGLIVGFFVKCDCVLVLVVAGGAFVHSLNLSAILNPV